MIAIPYPRDLASELAKSLAVRRPAAPSAAQLEQLLDVAFAATLLQEEGRPTVFTLGLVSEEEARRFQYDVEPFARPEHCAPGTIAKLAPATSRETQIGVRFTAGGDLETWGLVHVGDRRFAIDVEVGSPHMQVLGFRPGGLRIDSHGRPFLLYMNGAAHWYSGEDAGLTDVMREMLQPAEVSMKTLGSALLAHEFERLAERLVLAGHGGTILVSGPVDPKRRRRAPIGITIPESRSFRPPSALLKEAVEREEGDATVAAPSRPLPENPVHKSLALQRRHVDALDHVARLANVDGAVVMGTNLIVYGFGATIATPGKTMIPREIELNDPRHGSQRSTVAFHEAFKGHRHKSAAHFCTMQRKHADHIAIALVASQDGTLSLIGVTSTGIATVRPFVLRSVRHA